MKPLPQNKLVIFIMLIQNSNLGCGSQYRNDSTGDQLRLFAERVGKPVGIMTTSTGYPVSFQDTQTINTRLLFNQHLIESIFELATERIPERFVHGKGTGAFGYFKVTRDLSDICKAKLFNTVGKVTLLVARLSPVISRHGGSDTTRESRGFAVKFYTEEGNYDFVAINTEMFQMKDPLIFNTFVHSFHKNPVTQVIDDNARWDYITQRPEALSFFFRVFGDTGIPYGYRYMPAFTVHTFELLNEAGARTYVRFHLLPDLGIRNLTTAQANRIMDEDFATRDLYNAIAAGNYPTWTLSVQTIPEDEVKHAKFDIFDVTWYWPVKDYPLRTIGTLVLNKNPENQFADIEQVAFNPGNLVPGIRGVDTVFEARTLSYRVTQVHRLGNNFNKIRVNCPLMNPAKTYNRDGRHPVKDNEKDRPNYYPNSFNGPMPHLDNSPRRIIAYTDPRVDNFSQANEVYVSMTEGEKCRMVDNLTGSLINAEQFLQERAVQWYKIINKELGDRIHSVMKRRKNGSFYSQCDTEFD